MDLRTKIRDIPDFPKKGIVFKDITTLLADSEALQYTVDQLAAPYIDEDIDHVVGIESRGFIFGTALATTLHAGFIPVRKPGKLPAQTIEHEYDLEYGSDCIQVHEDSIEKGEKIIVVDDLLATGGTMAATLSLMDRLGADIVGVSVVIELEFLQGRNKLPHNSPFHALVRYDQ